jgi:N-methylhydantoinase A
VNVRMSAFGALPLGIGEDLDGPVAAARPGGEPVPAPASARAGRVSARLPGASSARQLPVYHRDQIDAGQAVQGPAIVHQLDTTTVVLPGQRARVDERGSLWLEERT